MAPIPVVSSVVKAVRNAIQPQDLSTHMLDTYFWLRRFLAWVGVLLPVVLLLAGWLLYDDIKDSMSAYYYESVRDIFVGALFMAGALLIAYKGFSDAEDRWLDIAAVLLVGVAVFPMRDPACQVDCGGFSPHGAFAIGFFVCIGFVVFRYSSTTLVLLADERARERFRKQYKLLGLGMPVLPLVAWALHSVEMSEWVFVVEGLGVWVFSAYWFLKTSELKLSQADRKAIEGASLPAPGQPVPAAKITSPAPG